MTERVLHFEEALAAVLAEAATLPAPPAETVSLAAGVEGRVLAGAVVAPRDQPPFDRSTRDGFALRIPPAGQAGQAAPPHRNVIGQVRAGERWEGPPLVDGQALEIMTGAPLPAGADAVVMLEHVQLTGATLTIEPGRTLRPGENIVPRGAEARRGDTMLPVGSVLGAAEIAVAASCGCAEASVYRRPRVAIVATGDELVELGGPTPSDTRIYNSNSYALAALVRGEGAAAERLPIATDTRQDLLERITQAAAFDLMLLSGGVSRGKYDLVEEVLSDLGAEFFFTGAHIQPGRPVVFGRIPARGASPAGDTGRPAVPPLDPPWTGRWTYFFGLPGNPVSTQVCFHLFVAPLLRALAGRRAISPRFVEARLAEDVPGGAKVLRFLPAEITSRWDGVTVRVVGWQGSGDVAANARGDGYAVLPAGADRHAAGHTVRVLLR